MLEVLGRLKPLMILRHMSTGYWDLIHGELVTFTDPRGDLQSIDRLEGFRPGRHSIHQREG